MNTCNCGLYSTSRHVGPEYTHNVRLKTSDYKNYLCSKNRFRLFSFSHLEMSVRILNTKQIVRAVHCIRPYSTQTTSHAEKKLIYTSPNVGLVKLVKKFSLSTLGVSQAATGHDV